MKSKVLVTLSRALDDKSLERGEVSVAGIVYPAFFEVDGFNRCRDFGKDTEFGFIIEPNGYGLVFGFLKIQLH